MQRRWTYTAVIAGLLATAQAASASPANPRVLVLVAPVATYVSEIMKGVGETQDLLNPGQEPHEFSLTPAQAAALSQADVLIVPEIGMSHAVRALAQKQKRLRIIDLSTLPGADPLPYATENPWLAAVKDKGGEKEDDTPAPLAPKPKAPASPYKKLPSFNAVPEVDTPEATTPIDPHFWLDPERMAALALPLAQALAETTPGARATLEANAREVARHLREEVLPGMKEILATRTAPHAKVTERPTVPFLTYHAAYQYFLERFGLAAQGAITTRPEDYLGAKTLDTLLVHAKATQIHCIIGETRSTLVDRIANLSGAKVVLLSPEQNIQAGNAPPLKWIRSDYDRLLYKTASSFAECL